MRSLWRALALQWLGGAGSETLADDLTLLDLLPTDERARAMEVFDVRREPGVSHQTMMRQVDGEIDSPEAARPQVAGPLCPLMHIKADRAAVCYARCSARSNLNRSRATIPW